MTDAARRREIYAIRAERKRQRETAEAIAAIGRDLRAKRINVDQAREGMRALRESLSEYDWNVAKLNSVKF